MLRLTNIVSKEVGVSLNDLKFEKGVSYAISSEHWGFNRFIVDLMRGYYEPDNGSVYVTLGGGTDNLITVSDNYIDSYSKKYVYLDSGVDLVEDLSIKDNMLLLCRGHRGVKFSKLNKLLKMVHIDDVNVRVRCLSESEKYRVKLAQILYMRPKLVICNMLFEDKDSFEMEEVESLLCDVCKYIDATLVYMGKVLNEGSFDVVMEGASIVKERLM